MDFGRRSLGGLGVGSSRKARNLAKKCRLDGSLSSGGDFASSLQFYDVSPKEDISLEEFERLALDRLEILRTFEKHGSLSASKYSQEWRENVEKEIKKLGLESYLNIYDHCSNKMENRRRDNYSHFILRLAYCRTEELRRWFIAQEMDLLRFRFTHISSSDEIQTFMTNNNLNFFPIDEDEKALVLENLNHCANYGPNPSTLSYYKVHFTEALDLVRNRKVFIKGGMCYVPQSDLVTLLSWIFKSLLQQNLALTAKTLPNLDEDDRLVRMLSDLDRRYTGSDYSVKEGSQDIVKPEMIQGLSDKSFPMCMRLIQKTLNKSHHIKYKARLQYGLFLKGIGLSLEDALRFFRGEFTKSHIDADKFDKEYTYGIRYNYGYEGKKVNWAPWNCMRIIMENVGPGENHGCPFRHYDHDVLRTELTASGVKEQDEMKEVMQSTKDGHYQRACACQFKATHGYELSTGITNHPNQFYQESIGGAAALGTSKNANLKTEKVMVFKN